VGVGPVGLEPTIRGLKVRRIAVTVASTSDSVLTAAPTSPTSRPWSTSFHATNHATPVALVVDSGTRRARRRGLFMPAPRGRLAGEPQGEDCPPGGTTTVAGPACRRGTPHQRRATPRTPLPQGRRADATVRQPVDHPSVGSAPRRDRRRTHLLDEGEVTPLAPPSST
jgi:hypothetical protein